MARDLLKVLSINDTLEVLELGGNDGIDEDMLEEIQRAFGRGRKQRQQGARRAEAIACTARCLRDFYNIGK